MDIRPIETAADHEAALARIDQLMDMDEKSPEQKATLKVLAILIERYEREAFPLPEPTALDAIMFRMEQGGYTQADLGRLLNSRSRASEIMHGRIKQLTLTQIRRLHECWHIPAELLIRNLVGDGHENGHRHS